MPTRRMGYVWTAGVGWVKKKTTTERDYSNQEADSWCFLISFFRWYPDVLLDILRADDADFATTELIQRVMMRAFSRYQTVDITGCRGLTKTYTKFCMELVSLILWPHTKSQYYGPAYRQMASIADKTYRQLEHDFPTLTKHFIVRAQGLDRFELETAHGSELTITAYRGDNKHRVTAEEYAQEEAPAFDYEEYKRVVLPSVRLKYMVEGRRDPTFIHFARHSITSAGRKQNHAYLTRCENKRRMALGESAFVMDVPWTVLVLSQMRPYEWAVGLRGELTPDEWMREMEARYTGADSNPVVRDEVLTESRSLTVMEDRHCGDDDCIYIVGYDVAYEDNKKNAKCAVVVLKLTRQTEYFKRDKFLKSVVYVDDWPPPPADTLQAIKLKDIWRRFCRDGAQPTYIAIDSWQYGKAVLEELMKDLNDGLPPLCIKNHAERTELELPNALPVIYPVKAGGAGSTDNEAEMLRYAEIQFEQRNVRLLTANLREGIEAYKKAHLIKDDCSDAAIAAPYQKTKELVGQIQNLKKVPSGASMKVKRISKYIQKDSWSALEYALRLSQILEQETYLEARRRPSGWDREFERIKGRAAFEAGPARLRAFGRIGGRRF